jgi:dolichyl-phosphate beta-glucosyltransferase
MPEISQGPNHAESDSDRLFLSIIIPAYNEEQRLAQSLQEVIAFCETLSYSLEVLVVDDGSTDRTAEIVEELLPSCRFLRLERASHGGKGHACKQGVAVAGGRWLLLCDADLAVPISDISKLEPLLADPDAAVVIASREAPGAQRIGEPEYRHLMGRVFNLVVRALAIHGIADTQCGFKCFRRDVAELVFNRQTIDGWGFDVELLLIARRHGHRIDEVPITWYYGERSKVRPIRDAVRMFREVLQIRRNARRGLYD